MWQTFMIILYSYIQQIVKYNTHMQHNKTTIYRLLLYIIIIVRHNSIGICFVGMGEWWGGGGHIHISTYVHGAL